MQSINKYSRAAGFLYLWLIITGIFAEKYVRSTLIDYENCQKTLMLLEQSQTLYRFGFAADLSMQLAFFLLPLALFKIFRHVNAFLSMVMICSVSVSVAIMCINMLNHLAPLILFHDHTALSTVNCDYTMLFLEQHRNGYHLAQLFFGFWLLPLGYMIISSGLTYKFIGYLLLIGSIGYVFDVFFYFLFPLEEQNWTEFLTLPADLGELSLCLYLLFGKMRFRTSSSCSKS